MEVTKLNDVKNSNNNENKARKMLEKVHRNEMFNCAINGKSCGYGVCDECPVTIGTFSF